MLFRQPSLLSAGALVVALLAPATRAAEPVRARHGLVVSQHYLASQVGFDVLAAGGNAVDAAVAAAFALAVVHPAAGNVAGGGFLVYRPPQGEPVAYDFRETAPAGASPGMFLKDGVYDEKRHHEGHLSVGVPGSVAGLHMAWKEHGRLPWRRLLEPAVSLAREGFVVSDDLARSLAGVLPAMKAYPASLAQFSRKGHAYEVGDLLRQPDLARTLERIAERGPDGFYGGETARLIAKEIKAGGGLLTEADLAAYQAVRRVPLVGSYRGYEVISMPPPSSGGAVLLQVLNVAEGWDLGASGFMGALTVHRLAEAMRRAYADRARFLGDPEANPDLPLRRLVSKEHAARQRASIDDQRASASSPASFSWPPEGDQTTHLSTMDAERGAVALTTTLEDSYGSKIVVPGAGFLLNNEMGDFNAGPGLTDTSGLIGTPPNLAAPGRRMLSSMTPTILAREGQPFLVLGSPGGRTIVNSVLLTILNVVDFGMNVQEAVDAPRFHHQWLPDRLDHEPFAFSPDTAHLLAGRGHALRATRRQGVVNAILWDAQAQVMEGASDRRSPDGAAIGR